MIPAVICLLVLETQNWCWNGYIPVRFTYPNAYLHAGGDCCGKSGDSLQYAYCEKCQCQDPAKAVKCPGTKQCVFEAYLGDKRCDDANNNCGCNWDGNFVYLNFFLLGP